MGEVKSWDAKEVTVSIAGLLIDSGFADGEFLRIEQDTDDWGDVVGTDGEVARFKTNDRRANVALILLQTSGGNDLLSGLSKLDMSAPNGAGIGAFLVRDRQGTSLYRGKAAWVKKGPNVSMGREVTGREWTLRVANLERLDGSN